MNLRNISTEQIAADYADAVRSVSGREPQISTRRGRIRVDGTVFNKKQIVEVTRRLHALRSAGH